MKTRRMRADLAAEIEGHIAERADELIDGGMPERKARERARREFGNPTLYNETGGETWGWLWLERLGKDFRYALRSLRASPLFTVTAVLSLALGIGANTAIFTMLYASLWRPLPVPAPRQLFHLRRYAAEGPYTGESSSSYVLFQQFRDAASDLGQVFATGRFSSQKFGEDGVSNERVGGEMVSANYFTALGVRPLLGRVFESQDDSVLGGRPVAILSHSFWTRRFQANPAVLGRTILYDEMPYTVVGVARPGFTGIDAEASIDVWVPVTSAVTRVWLTDPNVQWLQPLVRIRPGVSPAHVQALFEKTFRVHVADKLIPDSDAHWRPMLEAQHITLQPAAAGLATTGHKFEKPLRVLMVVVALVLLISCGNVANLILARNSARHHEIAIRLALGAGRMRIVSQLFVECLLLSAAAAACAVAIASWGAQLLVSFLPRPEVPLALDLRPGLPVLAFTGALALATALIFGLAPAWRAGRGAPLTLRAAGRVTRASPGGRLLVAGQLALSLILLAGAGLFVTTLRNLNSADLGFRPDHVAAFDLSFPKGTSADRIRQTYAQLRERLASHAGVLAASYCWPGIYGHGGWSGSIEVDGRQSEPGEDHEAGMINAGPDFFNATGMGLLHGRYFNVEDQNDNPRVAVVNESFARHYFGGSSAIGRRINMAGRPKGEREIVGVVRDARHFGVREKVWLMVYLPGWNDQGGTFFVRAQAALGPLGGTVRTEVAAIDKTAQIEGIHLLKTDVDEMLSQERLTAMLCSGLGALAVVLAAIGLYGVVAYSVSRRTNEFGIRMALGAQRGDVLRLVLRQTVVLVAAGVSAGLGAAMVLTRAVSAAIAGMLYGVSPGDTLILAGAAGLLTAIALLAAFLPARRASRIDPTMALRYE